MLLNIAFLQKLCWYYTRFGHIKKNFKEQKVLFEGQLARSQNWFAFDIEWPEISFKTREHDFKNIYFGTILKVKLIQKFQYWLLQL